MVQASSGSSDSPDSCPSCDPPFTASRRMRRSSLVPVAAHQYDPRWRWVAQTDVLQRSIVTRPSHCGRNSLRPCESPCGGRRLSRGAARPVARVRPRWSKGGASQPGLARRASALEQETERDPRNTRWARPHNRGGWKRRSRSPRHFLRLGRKRPKKSKRVLVVAAPVGSPIRFDRITGAPPRATASLAAVSTKESRVDYLATCK